MNIVYTILILVILFALTAFFVTWAKLEEEKAKTKEEHECFEAMLRLHNGVAVHAQKLAEKLAESEEANFYIACVDAEENRQLQDRLSSILCPRSDHVWEEREDGKRYCRKCGKEA